KQSDGNLAGRRWLFLPFSKESKNSDQYWRQYNYPRWIDRLEQFRIEQVDFSVFGWRFTFWDIFEIHVVTVLFQRLTGFILLRTELIVIYRDAVFRKDFFFSQI